MFFPVLLLILGFTILLLGADWLVKGASSLAKRYKVPEIVIGLTIVAMGTSTPELVVNVISSLKGIQGIVFGNVIGSNIFNILIILGISALIYPLDVQKSTSWKELPFALFTSALVIILVNDSLLSPSAQNVLSRSDGFVLLLLFIMFLIYTFKLSKTAPNTSDDVKQYKLLLTVSMIAGGLAALVAGGKLVVDQAVVIAHALGISEKVIALTIIAAGTSLPELATSCVAAYRKRPDIAVGNIVGSNIFNLLFIMGTSAVIRPAEYQVSFNLDFAVMLLATFMLFLFMFIWKKHHLKRWEGVLFLLMEAGYLMFMLR